MSYDQGKRGLDLPGALLLLLVSAPLWLLTLCALALGQGSPLFYRQWRVGRHGRPFLLLKFRTMSDDAPRGLPELPARPVRKDPRDPRVTPLGSILRRLKIDELPQLLNILRGEMSLVGPRPLPVDDLEQSGWLNTMDEEMRARCRLWRERREQLLPGLTGTWQISQNAEEDFENWISCDLAYADTRSLLTDLYILLCTPGAILRGRTRTNTDEHGHSSR